MVARQRPRGRHLRPLSPAGATSGSYPTVEPARLIQASQQVMRDCLDGGLEAREALAPSTTPAR